MSTPSSYCTPADVKSVTSDWTAQSATWDTRVAAAIINASAMVDQYTNTWWDQRHVSIKTQTCTPDQKRLFLPANLVSLDTNGVTENGIVVSGVVGYPKWIEKPAAGSCRYCWRPGQLNIVIAGEFGYATVPYFIEQSTAHLAGILLGMVQRSFSTPDGGQSATLANKMPEFIKTSLEQGRFVGLHQQPFIITALP